jgi:hypothetical protein
MMAHFGRTLCERRPAFFDGMALRRAREQQQQVDAGGGQRAPCLDAPSQLSLLAGREHGRTIPLTDMQASHKEWAANECSLL